MQRKRLSQVRPGDVIQDRNGQPFTVERVATYRTDNDYVIWNMGHSRTHYDIDGTANGWPACFISPAKIHGIPVKAIVL